MLYLLLLGYNRHDILQNYGFRVLDKAKAELNQIIKLLEWIIQRDYIIYTAGKYRQPDP